MRRSCGGWMSAGRRGGSDGGAGHEVEVAVTTATLTQMNERLGSIERRLDSLKTRLSHSTLGLGGFLAALMTIYRLV
jgi:hypothetical protein